MTSHDFRGKQACSQILSFKELTRYLKSSAGTLAIQSRAHAELAAHNRFFLQAYTMSFAFATTRRSSKASEDGPTVCVSTTLYDFIA
ncbi:hypothetical protein OCU04_005352 [Sclerotinia nivalis]|uniref:Uncharacterized protein n=1 Tax=Sclerotinia nivalis TaxID=352851 RepID=A0A9X0DLQ9_9HELO|nr:hypothetical protein OCU04_005352 [Sclerotinia nivalis]